MNIEEIINELVLSSCTCTDRISDGYHTFGELYYHRIELYITLCRILASEVCVWMSKKHSDDQQPLGWFLLGIEQEKGNQITYHIPNAKWEECAKFAGILDKAPEYDGHSSNDVLDRLRRL